MHGMSSKGSILLALLLLILGLYSGVFLFVQVMNAQARQAKYNYSEVRLQMLGYSGIARGRWLIKNNPGLYRVDLSGISELENKIIYLQSAAVYKEDVEGGQLIIGFSSVDAVFYVLAISSESSPQYPVKRFYTCSYIPDTGKLVSVIIN